MEAFLRSMTYPFLACLVVTGIHVYLGIHVISRKVIFVDLALATIAAFGAVWGALLGWDIASDPWATKGFSLAFTIVGAAVFSMTRMRHERVPHEAVIGITYAVALAAILLASAKLPHGAEEVRDLQAGSILWVDGATIVETAVLYLIIGAFHYAFRKRFLLISMDPARAEASGMNVRLWDFLFYASLGFVVTRSVSIAGVLLVFSYLVIPAVIAVLFAEGIVARLVIGWIVGTLVSLAGVSISYFEDLPSGPVIVVCFGVFLAAAGVVHYLIHSEKRGAAGLRVLGGVAALALFLGGSHFLRKDEQVDVIHLLEAGVKSEKVGALLRVDAEPALWARAKPMFDALLKNADVEVRLKLLDMIGDHAAAEFLPEVHALLADPDDVVRESALKCVRKLDRKESVEPLLAAAAAEEDEYLKVELAEVALELGDSRGIAVFLDVMERGDAEQARKDAFEHLSAHAQTSLPFHTDAAPPQHAEEIAAFRKWWQENSSKLRIEAAAAAPIR
ncbi:MAG TPA: iron chelate uptake ABC transporter family permease subunit [Planctomycetota bacterium]|nr:iron chelate uptake ABC transporter family permease subunit [Planctomycetota bacterium]